MSDKEKKPLKMKQKTWAEFHESKMLWFANRLLHVFGWAIVIVKDPQGDVIGAYPARVPYRGFPEKSEVEGFIGISEYMKEHAEELLEEAKS